MKTFKIILPALFLLFVFKVNASDNANVQSLYIYNFIKYIKWPENKVNSDFIIGVYGESTIYKELASFSKNRKVGTQNITVKVISKKEDINQCHLLYIPATKKQYIKEISETIGNRPILLVSEASNTESCAIEFFFHDNKLQFIIYEDKAKEQNLYMSQALVKLSAKN